MSDYFPPNPAADENRVKISPLKKTVFTVFLTILVIGLASFLGEILIRTYYCWRFETYIFLTEFLTENDSLVHKAAGDPILGYDMKPNFRGGYWRQQPNPQTGHMQFVNTTVSTNALGFRDKPYSRRKPPGTFRILVFGDSVTFGLGVTQKRTFSKQLEKLLNKPENPLKFEVMNCGITGYNIYQEIQLFMTRGLSLYPDLVIFNYVLNDQGGADSGLLWYFNRRNKFLLKYALVKNYRHYFGSNKPEKVLLKKTEVKKSKTEFPEKFRGTLIGSAFNKHNNLFRLEKYSAALRRVEKVCKSMKTGQVLVIFPYSDDLTKEHPLKKTHQNVRIVAEENGFSVIDLWDTFINHPPHEIYQENVHPNAKGFEVAANSVYKYLTDNRLVPVFPKKQAVRD